MTAPGEPVRRRCVRQVLRIRKATIPAAADSATKAIPQPTSAAEPAGSAGHMASRDALPACPRVFAAGVAEDVGAAVSEPDGDATPAGPAGEAPSPAGTAPEAGAAGAAVSAGPVRSDGGTAAAPPLWRRADAASSEDCGGPSPRPDGGAWAPGSAGAGTAGAGAGEREGPPAGPEGCPDGGAELSSSGGVGCGVGCVGAGEADGPDGTGLGAGADGPFSLRISVRTSPRIATGPLTGSEPDAVAARTPAACAAVPAGARASKVPIAAAVAPCRSPPLRRVCVCDAVRLKITMAIDTIENRQTAIIRAVSREKGCYQSDSGGLRCWCGRWDVCDF